MLIEKLKHLESLIEERNERKSSERVIQTLSQRQEELEKLATEWQSLSALASNMGMVNHTALSQLKSLSLSPSWVSLNRNEGQSVLRDMQTIISQIHDDLVEEWNKIREQSPSAGLYSRARFLMYVGDPNVRSQLQSLDNSIRQIAHRDLPTSNQYLQWQQRISELEQVIRDHLPDMVPAVERFFDKLTEGNATLKDVTPEIMEWCHNHDLTPRISLSFSDRV